MYVTSHISDTITTVCAVSGFESLQKLFAKSKSVIDKEGVPRFFIKALAELEDFTKEVSYTFRCQ